VLKALNDLLDRTLGKPTEPDSGARRHAVQLATAALLIEVVRADYEETPTESRMVSKLLKGFFDLSEDETALLIREAEAEADHAASLQGFTRRLHEQLSVEEKHGIVEMLWKVALADQHLDKYEDHLVRKVAGLLYVSHSDLIRLRNRVKAQEGG
jgi:uncharacterized tellurite resistance protein B-like protein